VSLVGRGVNGACIHILTTSLVIVAYETTDTKGPYTFVLAGALSEEQSALPKDAFGEASKENAIAV
jgi:hypothetical protein